MTEFSRSVRKFYHFTLSLAVLIILGLILAACGDEASTLAPATTTATTAAATTGQPTTGAATRAATSTPVVANAATTASGATTAATTTRAATTAAAAAPTNTAATSSSPKPTGGPTPTPIPVPTVVVPAPALQALDVVAQQAAKIRGLNFKTPVEKFYVTREGFAKYQTESFNQENPPEEIARSQKINELFGFIPKGYDLVKAYNDFSSSAVLGFYDPRTKKFYVVVDGDPTTISSSVKVTAEHELTHALQDQYFDTLKIRDLRQPGATEGNDDRDVAIVSLLEGDAVLSQTLWLQAGNLKPAELKQFIDENNSAVQDVQNKIKDLPLIIKEAQYFPYLDGAAFVQGVYTKGGWDAVNKMFTDYVPRSTSQIMHPEKYTKRVDPVNIDLPLLTDTLGQGWKLVEFNTMGELQASIWLKAALSDTDAKKAVAGWAGDRYEVLSDSQGRYGYIWRSQWDSEAQAKDFFTATATYLPKNYNLSGTGGAAPKYSWSGPDYDVTLVQKGNQVLLVTLPKGSGVDKVTAKLGF